MRKLGFPCRIKALFIINSRLPNKARVLAPFRLTHRLARFQFTAVRIVMINIILVTKPMWWLVRLEVPILSAGLVVVVFKAIFVM